MRIGIDIGILGAIALLNNKGECIHVENMPVMALAKGKTQVNAVELAKILERWRGTAGEPLTAFVEQVSAMPKQGVTAMFNFGKSYGTVLGVLGAERIPYILVTPQSWKRRAGLSHTEKDMARTKAQQLFPNIDLCRKKDIGKADAILIAKYGDANQFMSPANRERF